MAETLIYTTEKMVKENDAKIKEEDKKELADKAEAAKIAVKSENHDDIKKATEELSKVAQRVGTSLYQAQQGQPKTEETKPEEKAEAKPAEDKKE